MPTQEQIDQVTSVRRQCAGPLVLTTSEQQDFADLIANTEGLSWSKWKSKALKRIADYAKTYGREIGAYPWGKLKTQGDIKQGLVFFMRIRQSQVGPPCGYDINEIILSNPLDGQEHSYECPNCGNTGTYRAPNLE